MTTYRDNPLCAPVAGRIAARLSGMTVSQGADMLGASPASIGRMRAGHLPSAGVLLRAIQKFGIGIIEDVVGKFDDESLFRRLDAIEAILGDIRNDRASTAASSSSSHRDMGAPVGGGDQLRPVVQGTGDGPPLSLVQIRRSAADIAGGEHSALRRHMSAKVVSLEEVRAYARAHRDVGYAWKESGGEWMVDPAETNRLWLGAPAGPRPLARFPAPEYVGQMQRGFEEAALAAEPIVIEHCGFAAGENIHAFVARWGSIARNGTEICAAAFERAA